ncbi:RtcB family protein [Fulvivirgaceae bacterium BMA10]|uniref:3'-phosphate/5'-hydroxy nucleic acid ligase n=1 Tax=Splendidivirga corallicola TaxID=3051826 RepID=A0ABT8KXP9_9BACT|nr:RtcB family protein [Fulvivirgaceae bacterium BMA10]
MASTKLTGKDLRGIGFPEGRAIGAAIRILEKSYKGKSRIFKLEMLKRVVETPALFREHETLGPIAHALLTQTEYNKTIDLNKKRIEYRVYGIEGIEPGAINQMEIAMKLPITKAGALMPDAHQGYGLPIGGVLATKNAVIPYGVGVDIGCRMCMTIYDLPVSFLESNRSKFKKLLLENTRFGQASFKQPRDHEVLERKEFSEIAIIKNLKDRAYKQIGSSGGGNHFVEFGAVHILNEENELGLESGKYLGILSHSGSRGLGANIARHYTKLAMDICKLPNEAKHLAWLDLNSNEGQEYWLAMNLAGDYASACHYQIHQRLADALGEEHLAIIENHHNFAWKELGENGEELIVHRKGATPAGKGVLGIIPGSMTSPGFIVKGKGDHASINSASHGAGRVMSRTKAKQTLSKKEVSQYLKSAGVEAIGSGLDEAPMVYKDIHKVMAFQKDLIDVIGSFDPKVVRMCGDERFHEVD